MANANEKYLVNPKGETVLVPTEYESQALDLGYSPASDSQVAAFNQEVERIKKYDTVGQELIAGTEAAAAALTFGLSREAEEAFGVSMEEQRAREEINPYAAMMGTAVGIVAPALLSGGLTAEAQLAGKAAALASEVAGAGKAAQALAAAKAATAAPALTTSAKIASFTAPGLAARAGSGLSAASEVLMPGKTALGKALAKSAAAGIGAATENAILTAGDEMGDAVVGDTDLTAESFVHRVGLSAMLGGVGGAGVVGIPSVSRVLINSARGTESAKRFAEKLGEYESKQLWRAAGGTPGEMKKLVKQMGSQESVYKLVQEGHEMGLVSQFGSASSKIDRMEKVIEETGSAYRQFLDEADERLTDLTRPKIQEITERVVDGPLRTLSKDFTNQSAANELRDTLDRFRQVYRDEPNLSTLQDIKEKLQDKVFGYSKAAANDPNASAIASAYDEFRHIVKEYIDESMDKVGVASESAKVIRRQTEVAYKLKRLAVLRQSAETATSSAVDPAMKAAIIGALGFGDPVTGAMMGAAFEGVRRFGAPTMGFLSGAFKRALTNKAPKAVLEDLEAFSRQQADAIRSGIELGPIAPEQAARVEYLKLQDSIDDTITRMAADPVKYPTDMKSYLSGLRQEMWKNYSKKMSPAKAAKLVKQYEDQLTELAMPSKQTMALGVETVDAVRALRDGFRQSLANSLLWGRRYRADSVLAANRAADILIDPERMMALDGLKGITNSLTAEIRDNTANFLERAVIPAAESVTRITPALSMSTDRPVTASQIVQMAQNKREQPEAQKIANNAILLMNNPRKMDHFVSALADDVGHYAPKTGDAIKMTAVRAIQFLAQKAPKTVPMGPGMPDLPASKSDLLRFQRYLAAIDNPMLIIKHAQSGLVTAEEVEAVQAVYPRLFAEIRSELTNALVTDSAERPSLAPLSYKKRLGMSMLLKSDMTGVMKPNLHMAAQAAYRAQRQGSQSIPSKPVPVSRIKDMNVAGRAGQETAAWREAQEGARLR